MQQKKKEKKKKKSEKTLWPIDYTLFNKQHQAEIGKK